jgi:hypothetical protein
VGLVVFDLNRTGQIQLMPTARTDPTTAAKPSTSGQSADRSGGEALGPQQPAQAPVTVVAVPKRGAGTFTVAPGVTPIRAVRPSYGSLLRYRVEVENGSGQDATAFANAVDRTLSDRRSWTASGRWAFQRRPTGAVDFTILLATPDSTDRICKAGGLDPQGYTSCRTGGQVVINLARWMNAVPAFQGDVATYRQYVINHEVGHRLGQGHVRCGTPGGFAPVMQQQTLSLRGCLPNPWPYVNGKLLTGPFAPG